MVRDRPGQVIAIDGAVRDELNMMRGLLPALRCQLDRRVLPLVCASDAAGGTGKPYGADHVHHGAWCVAVAAPPQHEVEAVRAGIETVGRSGLLPPELGGPPLLLGRAPGIALLSRTAIPKAWCDGGVAWWRVLARRWARAIGICEGETRAAVSVLRIAARVPEFHGGELLDLVDNMGAVGLLSRGRSSRTNLNRQARLQAALEAATGIRLRGPWVSTVFQPADGGTREDASGALQLGRVHWSRRDRCVILAPANCTFIASWRVSWPSTVFWTTGGDERDDVMQRAAGKRMVRGMETYANRWVILLLGSNVNDIGTEYIRRAAKVALEHGSELILMDTARHWKLIDYLSSSSQIWLKHETWFHSCRFEDEAIHRVRVLSSICLDDLSRKCACHRKCSATGVAHRREQDAPTRRMDQ